MITVLKMKELTQKLVSQLFKDYKFYIWTLLKFPQPEKKLSLTN